MIKSTLSKALTQKLWNLNFMFSSLDTVSDLGRCCICCNNEASHLINLKKLATIPGSGWGCTECQPIPNGAIAAVCDVCQDLYGDDIESHLQQAVLDAYGHKKRINYDQILGHFDHEWEHED